jgi:hypothetical protein
MDQKSLTKFQPQLVVRLIPGAYKRELIPSALTTEEEAVDFAVSRSKYWNKKVCLSWEEGVVIWIPPDSETCLKTKGEPPVMRIA